MAQPNHLVHWAVSRTPRIPKENEHETSRLCSWLQHPTVSLYVSIYNLFSSLLALIGFGSSSD